MRSQIWMEDCVAKGLWLRYWKMYGWRRTSLSRCRERNGNHILQINSCDSKDVGFWTDPGAKSGICNAWPWAFSATSCSLVGLALLLVDGRMPWTCFVLQDFAKLVLLSVHGAGEMTSNFDEFCKISWPVCWSLVVYPGDAFSFSCSQCIDIFV